MIPTEVLDRLIEAVERREDGFWLGQVIDTPELKVWADFDFINVEETFGWRYWRHSHYPISLERRYAEPNTPQARKARVLKALREMKAKGGDAL